MDVTWCQDHPHTKFSVLNWIARCFVTHVLLFNNSTASSKNSNVDLYLSCWLGRTKYREHGLLMCRVCLRRFVFQVAAFFRPFHTPWRFAFSHIRQVYYVEPAIHSLFISIYLPCIVWAHSPILSIVLVRTGQ